MESIASRSPPAPSHEAMLPPIPAVSAAGLFESARYAILARQTSDTGKTNDDERDDAFGATRRGGGSGWNLSDTTNKRVAHKMVSLASASEFKPIGRQYVERRHHEHSMWHQGSDWYARRNHISNGTSYQPYDRSRHLIGMVPLSVEEPSSLRSAQVATLYRSSGGGSAYNYSNSSQWPRGYNNASHIPHTSSLRGGRVSSAATHVSRVVIPNDIVIPQEMISQPSVTEPPTEENFGKRPSDSWDSSPSPPSAKRAKPLEGRFDKLVLLCSATLELGPLQDNPTGCSCPKSKCIALYCDCFKAGRRCSPNACTCLNCKNTIEESGANGARSKAIQAILARNPRAFTNAGSSNPLTKIPPGEQACNCIRSRCLKLYCTCFQSGKVCNPDVCSCVGCLNTEDDVAGARQMAIQVTLEKRPDAFKEKGKTKEAGSGCACKNNRCIRKYCECFRTNLACSKKCCCRDCENPSESDNSL